MVMHVTNLADAKARLSEYLDRAAGGERILICRHNRPVAELRAVESTRTEPRPVGPLPGRPGFAVPEPFFEPLSEEELAAWEQGPADPAMPQPSGARGASHAAEAPVPYDAPAADARARTTKGRRQRP